MLKCVVVSLFCFVFFVVVEDDKVLNGFAKNKDGINVVARFYGDGRCS